MYEHRHTNNKIWFSVHLVPIKKKTRTNPQSAVFVRAGTQAGWLREGRPAQGNCRSGRGKPGLAKRQSPTTEGRGSARPQCRRPWGQETPLPQPRQPPSYLQPYGGDSAPRHAALRHHTPPEGRVRPAGPCTCVRARGGERALRKPPAPLPPAPRAWHPLGTPGRAAHTRQPHARPSGRWGRCPVPARAARAGAGRGGASWWRQREKSGIQSVPAAATRGHGGAVPPHGLARPRGRPPLGLSSARLGLPVGLGRPGAAPPPSPHRRG